MNFSGRALNFSTKTRLSTLSFATSTINTTAKPKPLLSFLRVLPNTLHHAYSRQRRYTTMVQHIVAKASEIGEGKMKEVPFGDTGSKVLLVKVKEQIHALSPRCTHYGAPLATAVLSGDGRIVCPWHGACFNASTGDIEDAPGLDNLYKFKVTIKDDDVYVEADEEALKSGKRVPVCSKPVSPKNGHTVVIIGGGASGNAAAEKLREDGFTGKITIISKETYLPIDRPKLSKSLEVTVDKAVIRTPAFYNNLSIVFNLDATVSSIDPIKKTVTTNDGKSLEYSSLIIATGANPRSIPIPGITLEGVLYLRTAQDNDRLKKALEGSEKKDLVIIGSSFIGMEAASIASKKANANVTVIGMEKVPFERVLGEKVGAVLRKLHEGKGVKFYLGAGVKSIEPSDVDLNKAGAVILQDGTKIPADAVLVGAGVAPATEFLRNVDKFPIEKDGSIRVNEYFKVEGFDDIYAIGDVARYPYNVTGESLRIEHWTHAENTGRAVASVIAKNEPKSFLKIPYFWSAQQGKGIRYAGYASNFDDVIIQGNLEEFKFSAYYALGDKVLAVATMGADPIASYSAELLRLNKFPSAAEIRNGKSPLDVPLVG